MSVLISVVVPIYKVEKYLKKCVDSIINQTYKNLEIILVDDGSPDNCGNICDEYIKVDNRIKVIHKENGGLSDARNVAIDCAKGEYITFVDSDDYLDENCIEYLYKLIEKNKAQLSICEFKYITEEGKILNKIIDDASEKVMNTQEAIRELLCMKIYSNSAWAKLYRLSDFEGIRYPKGKVFEDIPTTYKLFLKAEKIVFGARALYYYLYRDNSIFQKAVDPQKRLDAILFTKEMVDDIVKHYPEYKQIGECRELSSYLETIKKIPKNTNEDIINHMLKNIYRIRKNVLKCKECSLKNRILMIASYLPKNIYVSLVKRV